MLQVVSCNVGPAGPADHLHEFFFGMVSRFVVFRADSFEALEENNSLRASDRDYETWQAVEISQEVYTTSS